MDDVLNITKALADGNRLRVVMAMTDQKEFCVCQITEMLGLATPTVSRHMSVLQKAGLVKSHKDGRWVYYRLSGSFPPLLLRWLKGVLVSSDDIATDKEKMNTILACEPDALRKVQEQRRTRRAR
jgi:ArsR family transcriptional regulator